MAVSEGPRRTPPRPHSGSAQFRLHVIAPRATSPPTSWVSKITRVPDLGTADRHVSAMLRRPARGRRSDREHVCRAADRDALLAHLERCRTLEILDRSMVETALTAFVARPTRAARSTTRAPRLAEASGTATTARALGGRCACPIGATAGAAGPELDAQRPG
jgi:hypothetical protein